MRQELLVESSGALAKHLEAGLRSSGVEGPLALDALSEQVVDNFKEHMNDRQKAMLAKMTGADYAVDLQNCILAFAGRVLLRQARRHC